MDDLFFPLFLMQYAHNVFSALSDPNELNLLIDTLNQDVKRMNNVLLHHLKRKDRLFCQRDQLCDIITAYIQAISPKRSMITFYNNWVIIHTKIASLLSHKFPLAL